MISSRSAPQRAKPGEGAPVVAIERPAAQRAPVVLSSPHSGRDYPAAFTAQAALGLATLRRSEDSFVDELFAEAPSLGVPLLKALFPRVYVDPNREPFELDPAMFAEPLPSYVNTRSPRVAAGLGTIARVVSSGEPIYRDALTLADALARIEFCYKPYHAALETLVRETIGRFGLCIVIDCHSMPSSLPVSPPGVQRRVDIVLGDAHGHTCAPRLTALVEGHLTTAGFHVVRNAPYAGGHIARAYGRPEKGVHALQIEINRAIYMDEERFARGPGMAALTGEMTALIAALRAVAPATLAA